MTYIYSSNQTHSTLMKIYKHRYLFRIVYFRIIKIKLNNDYIESVYCNDKWHNLWLGWVIRIKGR